MQQRGLGVQHDGVWQQDVEAPQPEPSIWSNSPAAYDWLVISPSTNVAKRMFHFIEQNLLPGVGSSIAT
jgi:hypothetical protein